MPRRGSVKIREIAPDYKYNNKLVAKFINCVMKRGKKNLAEKIVYTAFELIEKKTHRNPLDVFNQAIENAQPSMESKSRRIGGATYQIPVPVRPARRTSLAIRWLIKFARKRAGKNISEKLAAELVDASLNTGATIKEKENVHKMAAANRVFAHYRW